ncbi:Tox-REase-5 domain-containing protein [Melittangium boletus]|uniref:Tox-REase-5 domain-containing protein n=1 Tax=Melittangium boletus TaxID=83453 RepID=UPI003DA68DEB
MGLLLVLALLVGGCATAPVRGEGSAGGFPSRTRDAFQEVQAASGLVASARLPVGGVLEPERARQLLSHLSKAPVSARRFAPRRVLAWLLREALAGDARVDSAELCWRAERFDFLVVLRPDGYWADALSGTPLGRAGPVALVQGEWRVGPLRVGDFYFSRGGVFHPVTGALRRAEGPPVAELGLGRDPLNAALEGAQDAVGELAVGLAQTILHPIRTVEGLVQLPETVALLIASSPEYFARYGALPREEQIREAARLSTHVLLLLGSAEATVGRLGGLGAPVLSLSARGELVWSSGRVAQGAAVRPALMGPGALSVLHMASRDKGQASAPPASSPGPGKWTYKKPTTESVQAREYQEQVAGRPSWYVYMVEEVEFDGFNGRELLEAKGASYKNFLTKGGKIQPWFAASSGFQDLLKQIRRQSGIARTLDVPVVWHVAEIEFVHFLRKLFESNGWDNIIIHHTPPLR